MTKAKEKPKKYAARDQRVCLYNEGVNCGGGECRKCGWNPKIEKRRKERDICQ